MHHDYSDIIAPMTALLRQSHCETKQIGDGPASGCRDEIDPQTERCTCVIEPTWWDEGGVPRFAAHQPKLCPDIYADEVALLEVACQGCDRRFPVQVSVSSAAIALAGRGGAASTLEGLVRAGVVHYGDPPNVGCCPAGPTMNVWDIRVIEFWKRTADSRYAWFRVPELETDLPDADPVRREFDVSDVERMGFSVGTEVTIEPGTDATGNAVDVAVPTGKPPTISPVPVTAAQAAEAARLVASQPQRASSGGRMGASVGAGAAAAIHFTDALCCTDPKTGVIKRCPARRCRAKIHTAADGATICERCDVARFIYDEQALRR